MNILESSKGNGELSLTVKGILVSLTPIVIGIMGATGVDMAESDYMQLVEGITAVIAGAMMAIGVIRKAWYSFKK